MESCFLRRMCRSFTVYLSEVHGIPTWVNKFRNENGKDEYNILPLDDSTRALWQEKYGLSDKLMDACSDSYDRTMELVGAGITESNEYLAQEKAEREAYYLSMVS